MPKRKKIETVDGVQVEHVTDIIGSVTGVDQGLLYWYGKNGSEECRRLVELAQRRGKDVHKVFEDFFSGRISDVPEGYGNRVGQVVKHFDERGLKPFATELALNNTDLGYTGTTDHVLQDNEGKFYIADYKTGRRDNYRHSPQLGMYAMAFTSMYDKEIEGLCDIYTGKEDDAVVEFMWYDKAMTAEALESANHILWLQKYKKRVNKHKPVKEQISDNIKL